MAHLYVATGLSLTFYISLLLQDSPHCKVDLDVLKLPPKIKNFYEEIIRNEWSDFPLIS